MQFAEKSPDFRLHIFYAKLRIKSVLSASGFIGHRGVSEKRRA